MSIENVVTHEPCKPRRKVIIDTDPGTDDAIAILTALYSPEVEVVALTTIAGNTGVEQVCKNVLRLLRVAQRTEVPVYRGCHTSILDKDLEGPQCIFHGLDGFGDVPDPDPVDLSLIQPLHAVHALIELGKAHKGEIELVCLGPLTNIAMAIRLDENFASYFKACYIMGGNYFGRGNRTPTAEFNFWADPEAAHIVIRNLSSLITLVCWEVCEDHPITWQWFNNEFLAIENNTMKLMKQINFNLIETKCRPERSHYLCADEYLMAAFLWPDAVHTQMDRPVCVLLGMECAGTLAVDHRCISLGKSNDDPKYKVVSIVTGLNVATIQRRLLEVFQQMP